ncbi:hypothetical protein BUALT_Bualt01G0192500 [Buddleja alternifolia]|uniref:RNA cytidine acetyltransferase n=1 Tax=Buddleja alternifolia TaxID=168488 RepID=A0AAV6Y9G3_9LAMI|nr:hypothetical protein BUALT_Bualt01G0192500 [Buddleja alternifolia]
MREKVDERIRTLIENGGKARHRFMFVIIGDKSTDQIVNLHCMLSKSVVKSRPNVLWCYKDKLELSSYTKKRMKRGLLDPEEADPFSLFVETAGITYCLYRDSDRILGNTFSMCILQDFEALTPNLLARTIETVEGGGLIVLLLRSLSSLTSLCTMVMDVHERYCKESHSQAAARFNERFLLSLASCKSCIVMDGELNILPISSHMKSISSFPVREDSERLSEAERELKNLKEQLNDDFPVGPLIRKCCTMSFVPEHIDYEVVKSSNPDFKKATVRIDMNKHPRQTIRNNFPLIFVQYIQPHEKPLQVELLVVDEAAAIPLPVVKSLLGPYLVFLSSTVNGYEGTGRSLSLKLLQQLEEQYQISSRSTEAAVSGRVFKKIELSESIRYASGEPMESWLNALLCLDVTNTVPSISSLIPPSECGLYYVNLDTLFSSYRDSELFLQWIMALFVASDYKYSPNDLQLMADAPAHHLFVLLGPVDESSNHLPDIFCVLQICFEGQISRTSAIKSLVEGARIVRIATHPSAMRLGYGSAAVELLSRYFEGRLTPISELDVEEQPEDSQARITEAAEEASLLQENIKPRTNLLPLLVPLRKRRPEKLRYLGVSFGLTLDLFIFWRKHNFVPFFICPVAVKIVSIVVLNCLCYDYFCILHTDDFNTNEVARSYFWEKIPVTLSYAQASILLCLALQKKKLERIEEEMKLEGPQILSLYLIVMKKFYNYLSDFKTEETHSTASHLIDIAMEPHPIPLDEELNNAA